MKRFYLFAWAAYEARGGLDDLVLSCDRLDDALTALKGLRGSLSYEPEHAQLALCDGGQIEVIGNYWFTDYTLDPDDHTVVLGERTGEPARWLATSPAPKSKHWTCVGNEVV